MRVNGQRCKYTLTSVFTESYFKQIVLTVFLNGTYIPTFISLLNFSLASFPSLLNFYESLLNFYPLFSFNLLLLVILFVFAFCLLSYLSFCFIRTFYLSQLLLKCRDLGAIRVTFPCLPTSTRFSFQDFPVFFPYSFSFLFRFLVSS